jgi:hypothetical protein
MTRLRRIAVATASALPLVVVLSQALPEWRDDPAKVRECISLVNGLMPENLTIEPHELRQELVERGVTLPLPPSLAFTSRDSGREAEALLRQYESAMKAYEAKWEDIKDSPEYQRAREAIRNRHLDKVLRLCLLGRWIPKERWPQLR